MTDGPIALRAVQIDIETMIRVREACDWMMANYKDGWSYGGQGVFGFRDHAIAVAFRLANPELTLREI